MSAVDVAVQAFRKLKPPDFRVLQAIELGMSRHEYTPEVQISKLTSLNMDEVSFRLSRLDEFNLILRWKGPYRGYALNMAGYDVLAINALVKADVIEALGKPLGIGKEADVYDALTPQRRRVAVKFHRLGRTSFRQTRRKRGYVAERMHISWLYQSRLAAEREYEALKLLYPKGVQVPEPIAQNRHAIVMGMIEGMELYKYKKVLNPQKVLEEILFNIRQAYVKANVIHADLSEFNVILQPNMHILIIDWPQFVDGNHPNAEQLLERDLKNIVHFFRRKHQVKVKLKDALAYVKGEV